jgi:hypothetical protein
MSVGKLFSSNPSALDVQPYADDPISIIAQSGGHMGKPGAYMEKEIFVIAVVFVCSTHCGA